MAGDFDYLDGLFEGIADEPQATDDTADVVGGATAEDDWAVAIGRVRKRIKEPLWIPVASPVAPDGGEPTPLSRTTISQLRSAVTSTDQNAQKYFDQEIARYERMRRGWYIPPMAEGELSWWKDQEAGLVGEIEAVLRPKLDRAREKLRVAQRAHYHHQSNYERYVRLLKDQGRGEEIRPPSCPCVRATRGVRRAQGSIKRVQRMLRAVRLRLRLESTYTPVYEHGARIETTGPREASQRAFSLSEAEFKELYGQKSEREMLRLAKRAPLVADAYWGLSDHDERDQPKLPRFRLIGKTPYGILLYGDHNGEGKLDYKRYREAMRPWLKGTGDDIKKAARQAKERDRKRTAYAQEKRGPTERPLLEIGELML